PHGDRGRARPAHSGCHGAGFRPALRGHVPAVGGRTPSTLTRLYFDVIDRYTGRPVALRIRRDGHWADLSYRELAERVHAASVGLRELGLRVGDRVAILSENRPEWAIADFACLAAG